MTRRPSPSSGKSQRVLGEIDGGAIPQLLEHPKTRSRKNMRLAAGSLVVITRFTFSCMTSNAPRRTAQPRHDAPRVRSCDGASN
jgi:hypothetical protein